MKPNRWPWTDPRNQEAVDNPTRRIDAYALPGNGPNKERLHNWIPYDVYVRQHDALLAALTKAKP